MKLDDFLVKTYGYNPDIKDAIKSYVEQWKSWYQGNVKAFHNYYIYNGKTKNKQTIQTQFINQKFINNHEEDSSFSYPCDSKRGKCSGR